jgi:ubiquinol-cytochrome c reductase cytochrome b subunit
VLDRYPVQMQSRNLFRRLLAWLGDHTGIEELPASSGWHQVLGSVALFAFLVQAATGILLARNYAPAPVAAYDSVRHIMTHVTAGRLLRALHYWGASLMVVVVVLHLLQTFVRGAYKKPRAATWIGGVILLLLTLCFGLTGDLLPWDNRAYWGTMAIIRLLGADDSPIGAAAFARFYVAHVRILPLAAALLIAGHVYLARRHSKAAVPVLKDTVAIFAWFAALMGMAILARVPLGHIAEPTDLNYVARPEWYFLVLFQFLKGFDGPLRVLGAVILPVLAIVALILVPFMDRGKMKSVRRRWGAIGLMALAGIFWGGLTARAIATTPESHEMDMSLVRSWQEISAGDMASIGFFRRVQCGSCHVPGKSAAGPDLTLAPSSRPAAWIEEHVKSNPKAAGALTGDQAKMLAAFVAERSAQAVDAWQNAPQNAVDGALIYQANDCGSCHKVNGVGDELGPALNGVGERHDRAWIEQHFADPPKYSPDSIMPTFQFKPDELKLLTDYLVAIPR